MANIIGNAQYIKICEKENRKIKYIYYKINNRVGIEVDGIIIRHVKYRDMKKISKYLRYLREIENDKLTKGEIEK